MVYEHTEILKDNSFIYFRGRVDTKLTFTARGSAKVIVFDVGGHIV